MTTDHVVSSDVQSMTQDTAKGRLAESTRFNDCIYFYTLVGPCIFRFLITERLGVHEYAGSVFMNARSSQLGVVDPIPLTEFSLNTPE